MKKKFQWSGRASACPDPYLRELHAADVWMPKWFANADLTISTNSRWIFYYFEDSIGRIIEIKIPV